jgi:3',5'-cyclic AMP phosphodiesterase CpdA
MNKIFIGGFHMRIRGMVLVFSVIAAVIISSSASAAVFKRHLFGDSTVNASAEARTNYKVKLSSFAHTTDVHLVDEGNPLRADELAILIKKDPVKLFELQKVIELFHDSNHYEDGIYTAMVWESVIESINDEHLKNGLDFLISTGDHSDSGIKDELRWFVDILDGKVPADFKDHINEDGLRTLKPTPEGLLIPWYAAIGNHDVEYMGSFNSDGFVGLLIKLLGYEVDHKDISVFKDTMGIYSSSSKADTTNPKGHGFAGMKTKGYYAFDPTPYIHCIVLNTAYFYSTKTGMPLETLAGGLLDTAEFNWALSEIEKNPDKLCILYSHHPTRSYKEVDEKQAANYVSGDKMRAALLNYENVIAYVNGHTHENSIIPQTEGENGYWDITTSGSHGYPQEWREITIVDNGDGTGVISCRMMGHQPVLTDINTDPRYPDGTDTILLTIFDEGGMENMGMDEDRDADLYFKIPDAVATNIKANYVPPKPTDTATPENTVQQSGEQAASDSDSSSGGMCFITASVI